MSDLPQLNNEPGIGASRGDMDALAREYRPDSDQRDQREEAPREARVRKAPTLLAILISLVAGWHWFAANHYENELTRTLGDYARKNLPDASVSVDVHPLTNLVEIEVTRNVARNEAAFAFFGDAIIEFVRQKLEPEVERELSLVARRDVDMYAMMVPYRVSISIDKVHAPPAPPPSRMVQEVQRQLSTLGYSPGPADGRLGQRTRIAIEAFQRDHGLAVDGRATGDLLDVLRAE
jgi:hypothetical protein